MLRATVVIDYQNVHLTARDIFCPDHSPHRALIHPMQYARAALRRRNANQREGHDPAEVHRVLVYRGLPHADYDPAQNGRNQEQAAKWREAGAEVHLRDLKYRYQRGADGRPILDVNGKKIPTNNGEEKGVDVLCALACVRESRDPDVDLVVLSSRDTDLVPALDEVYDMRGREEGIAKIETFSWYDSNARRNFGNLRASGARRVWNTNLDCRIFEAALDRGDYR